MNFDVRVPQENPIDRIIFANAKDGTTSIAHKVETFTACGRKGAVKIMDGADFVVIKDIEHADNLIKALQKAKDLGWLK